MELKEFFLFPLTINVMPEVASILTGPGIFGKEKTTDDF